MQGGGPNGIRIRVYGLKGRRPSPLDDGATIGLSPKRAQVIGFLVEEVIKKPDLSILRTNPLTCNRLLPHSSQ